MVQLPPAKLAGWQELGGCIHERVGPFLPPPPAPDIVVFIVGCTGSYIVRCLALVIVP
jgi:hypothetical protein